MLSSMDGCAEHESIVGECPPRWMSCGGQRVRVFFQLLHERKKGIRIALIWLDSSCNPRRTGFEGTMALLDLLVPGALTTPVAALRRSAPRSRE